MLANTIKKKVLILKLVILYATCSQVIDKHQKGLHISDYCPKIGKCIEGSHVMCTHYNPNSEMGPLCAGTRKVSITDEYADILLSLINGVRSKAARGLDVGNERIKLPRGYGIMRLQWDPELATFAQIWANQCIIDYDGCRATKKFPDPSQLLVVTRFTEPDWLVVSRRDYFNVTGFSMAKVKYALFSSVRSWYSTKRGLDPDIILGRKWSDNLINNPYLQLVQGSATHVGCGISIFKNYVYFTDIDDLILNKVRLVCNFSTRLREGQIYTTDPPTAVGYTVKCGCPLGYDEDPDCLCYESGRGLPYSCKYGQCKPQVVLLPIFTTEDASPHKFINRLSRRGSNMELLQGNHLYHYKYNGTNLKKPLKPSLFSKPKIFKLPMRKSIKSEKMIAFKNSTNGIQDINKEKYKIGNKRPNLYRNMFKESIENYNDLNINRQDYLYARRNKTHLAMNFPKNVKSIKKQEDKVMDLLNKLEQEATYIQIDEKKKDIFNQKLKKIYNTFLERTKFSDNKIIIRNNINLLDYEPNNLNAYEDQVRSIKESDDIAAPIINDNDKYNHRRNDEIFTKPNVINSVGIRKAFGIKEKRRNDDFDNIMDYSMEDGFLSLDRKKYYQDKLINLEKKINELRHRNNHRINPHNKYNT